MIPDWDTGNVKEGPRCAEGWYADWKLPFEKGEADISLVDTQLPRSWTLDSKEPISEKIDKINGFAKDCYKKFQKATDALELDLEGYGVDGSKNMQVKEKQTHGYASFNLKSPFTFDDCLPASRGFVRLQETGLVTTKSTHM